MERPPFCITEDCTSVRPIPDRLLEELQDGGSFFISGLMQQLLHTRTRKVVKEMFKKNLSPLRAAVLLFWRRRMDLPVLRRGLDERTKTQSITQKRGGNTLSEVRGIVKAFSLIILLIVAAFAGYVLFSFKLIEILIR